MRKPRLTFLVLVGALAASQLGATDCGNAIRDPGFDLWCGDQLCVWKVERGDVMQIPTWHKGDDGVDLVGDDTAISQLSPVASSDGACIEFDLIADVDLGPDVRLQADVFGDGTIELDEPIPASGWQPIQFRFTVDGTYDGIKFWIVKTGAGHAAVAELAAHTADCVDGPGTVISGGPAPLGAHCGGSTDCTSTVCNGLPLSPQPVCGECVPGAACPDAGDVCGIATPAAFTLVPYAACIAIGAKSLGELCAVGTECASGVCAGEACSTCGSCGGGETCAPAFTIEETLSGGYLPPFECSPGQGRRATGEPCVNQTDCASGLCSGPPRSICADGRPCGVDADCPVTEGLDHGKCETLGVLGGTCQ